MAYLNRTDHAVPLASGRVLAPGEHGDPDLKNSDDKALVSDGSLLKADPPEKGTKEEKA